MLAAALSSVVGGGQRSNPLLFHAPLTSSIIPAKGVGSPSFVRNSTATITDHEGIIHNCKSGEARFYGARRVENLGGSMAASGTAVITDNGDDTYTLTGLDSSGSNQLSVYTEPGLFSTNMASKNSVYLKAPDASFVGKTVRIESRYGGGTVPATRTVTLTADWVLYAAPDLTYNGTTGSAVLWVYGGATNTASSVMFKGAQIEDVTGRTNTNPSERVSVGVLSAPYHGANVDGVKYFDYANGNTVDANGVVTEARGAPLATCHGVLIEGARTNSIPYSENVALWGSTSDFTLTPRAAVAPDGRLAATLAVIGSAGTGVLATQSASVPASTNVAVSVMLKRYDNDWVCIKISGGSNQVNAAFNLATGEAGAPLTPAGTATYDSHYIEALPGGWYRCVVVGRFANVVGASIILFPVTGNNTLRAANTGLYVWGAQMEIGSRFASSYIPTNGVAASRAADVLTYPRANIHDAKGSSRMTFTSYVASAQYNQTPIGIGTGVAGRMLPGVVVAGLPYLADGAGQSATTVPMIPTTAFSSVALGGRWDANGMQVFAGGSAGSEAAYDGSFDGSVMSVGSGDPSTNGAYAYGMIKDVRLWKAKLSAAKLQELTA